MSIAAAGATPRPTTTAAASTTEHADDETGSEVGRPARTARPAGCVSGSSPSAATSLAG